jgi:tetratricopeptide (TPR) repeat protein
MKSSAPTKRYFRRLQTPESGELAPTVLVVDLPGHNFEDEVCIQDETWELEPPLHDTKEEPEEHEKEPTPKRDWFASALSFKDKGNSFFRIKDDAGPAMQEYKKALHCLRRCPKSNPETTALRVLLYVNLSACAIAMQDHQSCRKYTTKALKHDPNNVKAYYRRSVSRRYGGFDLDGAEDDLQHAIEICQNENETMTLKRALTALKRSRQNSTQSELAVAKQMFQS